MKFRFRPSVAVMLLGAVGPSAADEGKPRPFTDSLARSVSADVRAADEHLWEIKRELGVLPNLQHSRQIPRYGFQSAPLFKDDEPQWLQFKLRRTWPIDGIVLVPVDLSAPTVSEEGYGFPLRFKVEAGLMEDMSDAVVVVNETGADVPNPQRSALVYDFEPVEAAYVRVTSTKHWPTMDHFVWALGEVMAFSGSYNVIYAASREASSSVELLPGWSVRCANDGFSILELPVSMKKGETYGFLSEPARDPETEKWVVVDLGEVMPVDEVRLIPARPQGFTGNRGRGFPARISIELSDDREFMENVRRMSANRGIPPPWNNGVLFPCQGRPARYVRVVAHELSGGSNHYSFGLAELQVYSDGENVALHQPVTASDVGEWNERWAPEFLVDGYSSDHQLVEWPEYLASLRKRKMLEEELERLQSRRDHKAHDVAVATIATGSGVAGLSLLGLTALLVRQSSARKRDVTLLREQIARDLHDDLGSNLGSISLLSELGSRLEELPEGTRRDFQEIHDTAERSAEAMRDIVWLIDSGSTSLRELVAKMREAADQMFGEAAKVEVNPERVPSRELSLLFRRHTFFAFKEALNNARKHAGASEVKAEIAAQPGSLRFVVSDNGSGFDLATRNGMGRGLANLRRRARRLKGSCEIESEIGRGTTVRFEVLLGTRTHGGQIGTEDTRLAGRG